MSNDPKSHPASSKYLLPVGLIILFALLAAIGWNLLEKERARNTDKSIRGNLRQLAQGAEQYFTDHPGITSVASAALIGTHSSNYLRTFTTNAHESYTGTILLGKPVTATSIIGVRTITYAP
jgi:hypothetical protein